MTRTGILGRTANLLLAIGVVGLSAGAAQIQAAPHHANARGRADRLPQPGEFNVLVVVFDDFGTDKLGAYGRDTGPPAHCESPQIDTIPTPSFDALREDGVLFTRCYANPTCSPTRAALLTGRYGMRTGMGQPIFAADSPGYTLPASETTLPELIRDVGLHPYRRGAFGKWHLADHDTGHCHPADCGFERFEGTMGNVASHYDWTKVTATGGTAQGCESSSSTPVPEAAGLAPSEETWDAAVARADAVAWIAGLGPTERFFAYVAFNPPHIPIEVPPFSTLSSETIATLTSLGYETGARAEPGEHQNEHERLIFHANIEAVDHELGALLAGIPAAQLARTIVVVVGDNGTLGPMIDDPALIGHGKRSLYELGTRVPLVVQGPITPAGGTCRSLVGVVDLWRTLAELTGIRSAEIDLALGGTAVDSESFLAAIAHPGAALARAFAYSESFPNGAPPPGEASYQRGITDGSYRYMRIYSDAGAMTERLFHTTSDACELLDLLEPPHVLSEAEETALGALQQAMDAI